MSDALSASFAGVAGKPMHFSTKAGFSLGLALAGFSVIGSAVMLLVGSAAIGKGAMIGALLFNSLFLFFAYRWAFRGRSVDSRGAAALILFVLAAASGVGLVVAASKAPAFVIPVVLYGAANLAAFASFVWDLSDDR